MHIFVLLLSVDYGDFSCICFYLLIFFKINLSIFFMNTIRAKVSNTLDPDQDQ